MSMSIIITYINLLIFIYLFMLIINFTVYIFNIGDSPIYVCSLEQTIRRDLG